MEDENPFTKAQTIDPEVRAYVYSLVNALGGTSADESGTYTLGDDALAVLRDLKRWLKLYDEKTNRLDVARCLAEANLVRGDLLPILSTWKENGKNDKAKARVALACFELLVPLTWPLEQEEMTLNHHRHTPYILQSHVKYKAAVLHWESVGILRQAIRSALPALAMQRQERAARDDGIIKLVLYFLRNIAIIRQVPNLPSQGLDIEVSRSATIESFRDQDVFALLLTMCSNMGEDFNHVDVVILEIIFNLIKGVDPTKLWMDKRQRTKVGLNDLKQTLAMEEAMHMDAKKTAWSRHGRFGTMIWVQGEDKQMKAMSGQDNLKSEQTAMFNMDNNKKWNKPLQRRKDLDHSMHDFDQQESLTSTATEQLRNFAEEFLDSGFNPLISHLRKAIEREAERLLPVNYRQFFYVVAWFLKAERTRRARRQAQREGSKTAVDFDPEGYGLVAAVFNQETFITINRYMQMSWDEKAWQDLNASMRCFTEILLTIQDMARSNIEEDQDIAENIQNRIFYEESTHDRVRLLLQGYKDQGVGYLDACTELAHVFLKMLEQYSKENVDLQIRSKRKARRRKRAEQKTHNGADPTNAEQADEESEHEDILDTVQVSKERKFDFKRFAAKFVTQGTVDTFVCLLKFYKDLTLEQLKRVHRFLYRTAFKQEQATLLYRVDIIALLYKITEGPEGLSKKHPLFDEWQEFNKQLFRRLFKKIDQRPELIVELLFSKINSTLYYLEHGHDRTTVTLGRPPAELEVKNAASRPRSEQIGIVVTVLLRDHKDTCVDWVKRVLERAHSERSSFEATAQTGIASTGDQTESMEQSEPVMDLSCNMPTAQASYISVLPENDEICLAMFKNARLKLLMKLVGMVEEVNDKSDTLDATWILPSHVTAAHLLESKEAIQKYTAEHWVPEHEDDNPEDFLRRTRKDIQPDTGGEIGGDGEARRDGFIDDSEGDDVLPEEEEFLFPDNPRQKRSAMQQLKAQRAARKRKRSSDEESELDSEEEAAREERRRKRKEAALERRRKYKSEAFIRDSDDESDDERDRAFFRNEALLRNKFARMNKAQATTEAGQELGDDEDALMQRRRIVARLRGEDEDDEARADEDQDLVSGDDSDPPRLQRHRKDPRDHTDSEDDSIPPSTPPTEQQDTRSVRKALRDLAQGRVRESPQRERTQTLGGASKGKDVESITEEIETTERPLRASRGGFVIDDSDDE